MKKKVSCDSIHFGMLFLWWILLPQYCGSKDDGRTEKRICGWRSPG